MEWAGSPSGTVWRKRLHRVGPVESGQVTSLVRFEAGASFEEHGHPEGEEIFVLEGTFSDESGSWGAGWYLLNPDGSRHRPYSKEGCLLFVKLRQYGGAARTRLQIDTAAMSWTPTGLDGVAEKVLFRHAAFADTTRLERWGAGTVARRQWPEGVEIFVLEGRLEDGEGFYEQGSWLRLPAGYQVTMKSSGGCELYVKEGGVTGLRSSEEAEDERAGIAENVSRGVGSGRSGHGGDG
jgi:anti-sigma factor ChrR (cupin superfamily)